MTFVDCRGAQVGSIWDRGFAVNDGLQDVNFEVFLVGDIKRGADGVGDVKIAAIAVLKLFDNKGSG